MMGSRAATAMRATGPPNFPIMPNDPRSSAFEVEPASWFAPWGVMARSSAPTYSIRPAVQVAAHQVVDEEQGDEHEGHRVDDLSGPVARRRKIALDQRRHDAHCQTHDDRYRQAAEPGRDDGGEGGCDENGEVVGVKPDDGSGQHAGQAGEEGAHGPHADGHGIWAGTR
jgi:hypothetical protein